jgi:hypothetical protein
MPKDTKTKISLPYAVDIIVFNFIVDRLAKVGEKGMKIRELFKIINAPSKPLKSKALSFSQYLGFVITKGDLVLLSNLGSQYSYIGSEEEKKNFLAIHLPMSYITILNWIKDAGGVKGVNQIKNDIIKNWGTPPAKRVFNDMINTFARICEYVGLIKYTRGGSASRCELTKVGYDLLSISVPYEEIVELRSPVEEKIKGFNLDLFQSLIQTKVLLETSQSDIEKTAKEIIELKKRFPTEFDHYINIIEKILRKDINEKEKSIILLIIIEEILEIMKEKMS